MASMAPEVEVPDDEDFALQAELEAEAALARKYGGLPKCNPMIAHSLKGGKHYFDSGDYVLQQNGAQAVFGLADPSSLPLAYDHHARTPSDAEKVTSQPPRLDKRPGVTSPRGKGRSGPASPCAGPNGA
ncbi:hypothetical protein T492DRAFT_957729 [Pavlovales sp. CCMP2436]|nr:hypothetical protein T492DRAFT_957729 [Pavlovales sp. CCMP2436]